MKCRLAIAFQTNFKWVSKILFYLSDTHLTFRYPLVDPLFQVLIYIKLFFTLPASEFLS